MHLLHLLLAALALGQSLTLVKLREKSTLDEWPLKYPKQAVVKLERDHHLKAIAKLSKDYTSCLLIVGSSSFVMQKKTSSYAVELKLTDRVLNRLGKAGNFTSKLSCTSKNDQLDWDIGTIVLDFAFTPDSMFAVKPEIAHQFRPDRKPDNLILSYAFSALTVVPWLWIVWSNLNVNAHRLFKSPSVLFNGIFFLASLSSFIGLYFVYWLQLTLFHLLGYGAILSVTTFLSGYYALRSLLQ